MQPTKQTRVAKLLLAGLLMTFATGYTSCEEFSEVVVPSANTTAPVCASGLYEGGSAINQVTWDNQTTTNNFRITDYASTRTVWTSVIDRDGAMNLNTRWNVRVRCCTAATNTMPKRCDTALATNEYYHGYQEQTGVTPGKLVSNGIYDYFVFTPKTELERACGTRARSSSFFVGWEAVGWGYKGPASFHNGGAYYNAMP